MYRLTAKKGNKIIYLRDTGLTIIYSAYGFSRLEEEQLHDKLVFDDIGQSIAGNLTHCKRILIKYLNFDEEDIIDYRTDMEKALDLKKCTITGILPQGVLQ